MTKGKNVHVKFNNPSVRSAEHYIRMVGTGDLLSCILIGPAGMGKTHLVRETLEQMNVPFKIYGGHITLAEIYEYLYENKEELIFFDDVSQVVNKIEIIEMLKQALNVGNKERVLNYRSKNALSPNVPNSFVFTGRILFAFNKMDSQNPNVKAIIDRSPMIELKYSRREIFEAFYQIAESNAGGLLEYEKILIINEIEQHTDNTMDVSLRKLFLAFKVFSSFKKMYGEGNMEWQEQVRGLFGKKKQSWMRQMIIDIVGIGGVIKRTELAKQIALRKDMSLRNAQRKINEFLEMEEIFQNKLKGGDIKLTPFS